eukprot:TRINITY_DN14156_c0_g1_i1.p1 TRINITY_DN14156_c0_g1~~TRINITY_DN14156_c0_g1_i1.p1  ORF type:complete len:125 (-),score=4.66 TRINITY_DN14156_c0_g1_i1:146-520(-)
MIAPLFSIPFETSCNVSGKFGKSSDRPQRMQQCSSGREAREIGCFSRRKMIYLACFQNRRNPSLAYQAFLLRAYGAVSPLLCNRPVTISASPRKQTSNTSTNNKKNINHDERDRPGRQAASAWT